MITLYEKYEFDDDYQNVFYSKQKLDLYLITLNNLIIYDDIYLSFIGKVNLNINASFFPNYIKYESNDIVYYYFIKNWNIINNIVEVEYIIDVWHSFLGDFSIRQGIKTLCNSYSSTNMPLLNYIESPEFNKIKVSSLYTQGYVIIFYGFVSKNVIDISNAGSVGSQFVGFAGNRDGDYSLIEKNANDTYSPNYTVFEDLKTAMVYATNLKENITTRAIRIEYVTSKDYVYAYITHIYIIPKLFLDQYLSGSILYSVRINTTDSNEHIIGKLGTATAYIPALIYSFNVRGFTYLNTTDVAYMFSYTNNDIRRLVYSKSYKVEIGNNFPLWVGTLAHHYNIKNIKNDQVINFYLTMSSAGIKIEMETPDSLFDITNDFLYTYNFSSEDAQGALQRNISAKIDMLNAGANIGSSVISSALGYKSLYTKNTSMMTHAIPQDYFTNSQKRVEYDTSFRKSYNFAKGRWYDYLSNLENTGISITNTIWDQLLKRSAPYNNVSVNYNTDNFGLYFSICECTCDPLNIVSMQKTYDNYGLIMSIYSNLIDNDFDILINDKFDLARFEECEVIGKLPQQFKAIIKKILTDGVRIWHTNPN